MLKEEMNVTNYSFLNGNSEEWTDNNTQTDHEVITLLESDTIALSHQVSGHSTTGGVLKHKTFGYVLKPIQKDHRGSREVEFYTKVFRNDNSGENGNERKEDIQHKHKFLLKKYLPNYFGVARILSKENGNASWKYYVGMEDLVEGFSQPCLVDIKIGSQTWDPLASLQKIAHEKSKYLGTKVPLGLCLTGMQYFNLTTKNCIKMDRGFGKTLINENSFVDSILTFFNNGYNQTLPKLMANKLLPRLKEIREYFEEQREFNFYSTSLLIGYDSSRFDGLNFSWDDDINSWLRVYMIDFCHVFPMGDNSGPDNNYLFGLSNLIRILQDIGN